ncbi:MAG: hypothetical protein ACI88H_003710 [Cocleimonas sp.]|jgi:hypothetical protein
MRNIIFYDIVFTLFNDVSEFVEDHYLAQIS